MMVDLEQLRLLATDVRWQFSSNAGDTIDKAADEIERLRALSQNNAHSWDAIVRERDALRTSLGEMLADLDDPELIEISAATITRARQALSSGQLPKGVDREPEYLKQRREHPDE